MKGAKAVPDTKPVPRTDLEAFNAGLMYASLYLVATAEDFEQTHARLSGQSYKNDARNATEAESCKQKAALLRGQARHVLELRPVRPGTVHGHTNKAPTF